MAAQIRQVGENLKAALQAAGATLNVLVGTKTFVTGIAALFRCLDVRGVLHRPGEPWLRPYVLEFANHIRSRGQSWRSTFGTITAGFEAVKMGD